MNQLITNDFTKLSAFSQLSNMDDICCPLRHLGIHLFTYVEHHPDNTINWLTNNEQFIAPWLEHYKLYLTQHPFILKLTDQSGWYLWEPYFGLDDFADSITTALNCRVTAGITYVEVNNGIKYSYGFASAQAAIFYYQVFQQRSNLYRFIHYFKQQLPRLCKHSLRFALPSDVVKFNKNYYNDEYLARFQTNQELFLQEINSHADQAEFVADQFNLTKRERECLNLLLKSYSSKQIAKNLNLSVRTAEKHIQNIRSKTCCQSITDLVLKIQPLMLKDLA